VKDRNLQREARVSICVEDGYRFVTISGVIETNDDQEVAQEDIRQLAIRYHGQEAGDRQSREQFSKQHRITLRLPIGQVIEHGLDEES
jgi:hypothetical protein